MSLALIVCGLAAVAFSGVGVYFATAEPRTVWFLDLAMVAEVCAMALFALAGFIASNWWWVVPILPSVYFLFLAARRRPSLVAGERARRAQT